MEMEMAASTSAHPNYNYRYDVFVSHTGPDVRQTFAGPLYRRLIERGLRVFLDQGEQSTGEELSLQIQGAIKTASVHVAVFSPTYAESSWCLNELLLMLESGAPIIPVSYNVRPADLRWTQGQGVYARSLYNLERKRTYDSTTIEKWRNALFQVSGISGFELDAHNRDEDELLDIVVQAVFRSVGKKPSSTAKYLVGLDEKVKDFENKVFRENHGSAKPQVVGIVGVGGVGKTTLAKEFFDRKTADYSKFCFLSNVRENARKGLLSSLQRQLLKTFTGKDALINSIDEGKVALKKHLSSCGVLMILDDVDHLNQIDALLPVPSHLLSDSLVVITSREEKVIRSSGVENASIYQLTGLNHQHSRELFCTYAFNQPYPRRGFESLVDNFLKSCEGLPLLLRVLGAPLNHENDKSYWKDIVGGLQQVLPNETQAKLRICYQILNMEERQMFLDSSCFFIGRKRDTAIRIWEGSGWKGRLGFRTLEVRCLIEVDSENNIDMHDHIRDFGRAVAATSSPRRLLQQLSSEQVTTVRNEPLTAVRGIRMVLGEDNGDVDPFGGIEKWSLKLVAALGGIDMWTLELLDTEAGILERILRGSHAQSNLTNLIWLRWNKCPEPSLPRWIHMKNIRVLQLSGNKLKRLWEDFSQAPLQLRELEVNAPLSNIPKSIRWLKNLERIVIGKFASGQVNLTNLPEEFCDLQSLKDLVLTDCSKMKTLPNPFDGLWALQHIDLSFCRNLERLPDSLGYLSQLQHINLSYCHDLERLPDSICGIRRLQHIDLRGCHNLERLPDSFGNLKDLRHINLSGCHDLQRLPDSFGKLTYLQHVDLQGCHNLEKLLNSFGDLMNLQYINLSNCHSLERLPFSFGYLSNLQHIDISGCHNLERLPNYFRYLTKLKYLNVEGCSSLIIETLELSVHLIEAHQRQLQQLF